LNTTSFDIDALIGALAKAKLEIPTIPMTGRNPFFKNTANPEGSKYSTLTDLFNAVNPALSKNGLVLTQCPHAQDGRISIISTIFHSSGQWIQNGGTPLKPDKDTAQGIASTITYGKRQEAFAILGLSGDIDDDGNNADGLKPKDIDNSLNEKIESLEKKLSIFLKVQSAYSEAGIDSNKMFSMFKEALEKEKEKVLFIKDKE
jgi:hypothetical protein